jgi:hypothetical protein
VDIAAQAEVEPGRRGRRSRCISVAARGEVEPSSRGRRDNASSLWRELASSRVVEVGGSVSTLQRGSWKHGSTSRRDHQGTCRGR